MAIGSWRVVVGTAFPKQYDNNLDEDSVRGFDA